MLEFERILALLAAAGEVNISYRPSSSECSPESVNEVYDTWKSSLYVVSCHAAVINNTILVQQKLSERNSTKNIHIQSVKQ